MNGEVAIYILADMEGWSFEEFNRKQSAILLLRSAYEIPLSGFL